LAVLDVGWGSDRGADKAEGGKDDGDLHSCLRLQNWVFFGTQFGEDWAIALVLSGVDAVIESSASRLEHWNQRCILYLGPSNCKTYFWT
jgi:hypothetical protein